MRRAEIIQSVDKNDRKKGAPVGVPFLRTISRLIDQLTIAISEVLLDIMRAVQILVVAYICVFALSEARIDVRKLS